MLQARSHPRKLFAAGARASSLGIALLDSETRFELVNASLARETEVPPESHIGKFSRDIVGDLAKQIEPTYENVLRTGEPESILLTGHVRNAVETGYWLDYCFPITNSSGRVQQLGVFVVNISAERAAAEVFESLATDSKRLIAEASGLLSQFDEAIQHYHRDLELGFSMLAHSFDEPAKRVDRFRRSMKRLDNEINAMRDLIYCIIAQFSIPEC